MGDFRRVAVIAVTVMLLAVPVAAGAPSSLGGEALYAIASGSLKWVAEANMGLAASEPETWMMLLGGFGLIGSTLRRRNRGSDRRQLV